MKTLISSTGNTLDANFDLRFGRASWFCILEEERGSYSFFENPYKDLDQTAGRKVVEHAMGLGIEKVISGDFGPKAKELLDQFHVQMVILPPEPRTIRNIIETLTS